MAPKYPNVSVPAGDANAYAIVGSVQVALRRAGVPASEIADFTREAQSGDYANLLQTAKRWVDFG